MPTLSQLLSAQTRASTAFRAALDANRLHHAYLVAGPRDARPHELARALANRVLCSNPAGLDTCGTCSACRKVANGNHPDLHTVVADGDESISIAAVRQLSQRLALRAAESATKVALFEHADQLTLAAQHALLKTLEEPAGATLMLLASTRPRTLLATVRSRCQRLPVAAPAKLGAAGLLQAAGVETMPAHFAAALTGADVEAAQQLAGNGASEVLAALGAALAADSMAAVLEIAADLGGDAGRFELALAFLEVMVRDGLARAQGADAPLLYLDAAPLSRVPRLELSRVAARLQHFRQVSIYNPNRTMVLEGLLLGLHRRAA